MVELGKGLVRVGEGGKGSRGGGRTESAAVRYASRIKGIVVGAGVVLNDGS